MSAGTDGLGELGGPATRAGLVFSCFAAIGGQEYRCLVIAVVQAQCECLDIIPKDQALRSASRSTRYEAAGHTVARVGRSTRVPIRVRS